MGDFPTEMVEHFFRSFCENAGITMHIKISGRNVHHQIEALFKAFAVCLRDAVQRTHNTIPSSKGTLT